MKSRKAFDSIGEIQVPQKAYYDAQTARSLQNFPIGNAPVPFEVISALAEIKKAAAKTNLSFKDIDKKKTQAIIQACDEVIEGKYYNEFPLRVYQTGSGTHSNMNVNEVIANRAIQIMGGKIGSKKPVHPNDDVNMSQSSNDTFPSAVHIAVASVVMKKLLPSVQKLIKGFDKKAKEYKNIVKIGRTHLMDATPITLGQEISAFSAVLKKNEKRILAALKEVYLLPLGGTAVGTGMNTRKGYAKKVVSFLAKQTRLPFKNESNMFASLSMHDALAQMSSSLELLAATLMKVANDIRLLASGPRCGLGEIILPANEPGSSIMSGKVNPTQAEALIMVCLQVKGYHRTIVDAAYFGDLQINIAKPVIAHSLIESVHILSDACSSFYEKCISGIQPHKKNIQKNLENSLMLVTALNKKIGYDMATEIAKKAYHEDISLKEAAVALGYLSEKEFEKSVNIRDMLFPQ